MKTDGRKSIWFRNVAKLVKRSYTQTIMLQESYHIGQVLIFQL